MSLGYSGFIMQQKVTYFAPATAANLAAGFEIFGMALEQPGDYVTAQKAVESGVQLLSIEGDGGKLPTDASKNTATVAISALLKHLNYTGGIGIHLKKQLPLCSGMGSSAASSAAAVAAVNYLLDAGLTAKELVPFAMEGERIACGSAHADNVAPSLMGGMVLIRSYYPLDIISLPVPDNLYYAVVNPDILVSTAESRARVPQSVILANTIAQTGNAAAFVAALASEDMDLLGRSCEDFLAEPSRAELIPGFSLVKQAALDSGASGAGLSGSGPSMFALCSRLDIATQSATAMQKIFTRQGITSNPYYGKVNTSGATMVTDPVITDVE